MLQRDYLMQLIAQFIDAVLRSRRTAIVDPRAAAHSLELAICDALDLDGAMLLSLGGESMAQVMELSGVDPRVAGYIAHSLKLEAEYLTKAGEIDLAALRLGQSQSVVAQFGIDMEEIADELRKDES